LQKKTFAVGLQKASSEGYDASFVMSSTGLDRDGDRISKAALEAQVGKRPIALWQHRTDQVLGTWENVRLLGNKLVGDLKIAGTNLGMMVKALLADNVPLSASIGFMGTGDYDEERRGINWKEIELLECSVVSVPANADAQRRELAARIAKSFDIDPSVVVDEFEEEPSSKIRKSSDANRTAEAVLANAKRQLAQTNLYMRNRRS
jgi:HK97 family phage prohead protease